MKTIAYTCKLCRRPGEAKYDDTEIPLDLGKWVSMLTCNRCYDYRDKKRLHADDIWRTCYDYSIARNLTDDSKRSEAVKRAREALVRKTKAFAGLICTHWNKMTVWEPDFVQMLLDHPDKSHQVLRDYERGVEVIT